MSKEIRIDRRYNARGVNYRNLVDYLKESGIDLSQSFSVHIDVENNDMVIRQGFEPVEPTTNPVLDKILEDDETEIQTVVLEMTPEDKPDLEPKKKPGRPSRARNT